jgi:hypothetical protein
MEFKHKIVFDSKGNNINISNKTDEIETLLTDSPIIAEVNGEETLVGAITNVQNRPNTTLYYGDIYIIGKFSQFKKFEIVGHDICYKEPPLDNIYDAINIVTHIKEK